MGLGTRYKLLEGLKAPFRRLVGVKLLSKKLNSVHEDVDVHLWLFWSCSPQSVLVKDVEVCLDYRGVSVRCTGKLPELMHGHELTSAQLLKDLSDIAPYVQIAQVISRYNLREETLVLLLKLEFPLQDRHNEELTLVTM